MFNRWVKNYVKKRDEKLRVKREKVKKELEKYYYEKWSDINEYDR